MGKGRIIKGIAGFYYVHDGHAVYECKAKGSFRNQKLKPLVGDDVLFETVSEAYQSGNITEILPRKSELVRPAVANVDEMILVFSATVPAPNYEMLNRYLVSIHDYGIPVRLVVTKADLSDKNAFSEIRNQFLGLPAPMHFVSVKTGEGLPALKKALHGKVSSLAGPSGVGKSSLLNALMGGEVMAVGALSEKIERGKNTTRHAELFFVEEDTYLLDTPGFTSVDFDAVSKENLALMFDEFVPLLVNCRFSDCTHRNEPGCAVTEALKNGRISKMRYESYANMYEHLLHLRRYP